MTTSEEWLERLGLAEPTTDMYSLPSSVREVSRLRYENAKGLELNAEIKKLAADGLGVEDVMVRLNLPKTPASVDCVRKIVLGQS